MKIDYTKIPITCDICGKKHNQNEQGCDCGNDYPITSVCKADLLHAGFTKKQINSLDDADMAQIASKMADAYCDNGFWIDLPIIVEYILENK